MLRYKLKILQRAPNRSSETRKTKRTKSSLTRLKKTLTSKSSKLQPPMKNTSRRLRLSGQPSTQTNSKRYTRGSWKASRRIRMHLTSRRTFLRSVKNWRANSKKRRWKSARSQYARRSTNGMTFSMVAQDFARTKRDLTHWQRRSTRWWKARLRNRWRRTMLCTFSETSKETPVTPSKSNFLAASSRDRLLRHSAPPFLRRIMTCTCSTRTC